MNPTPWPEGSNDQQFAYLTTTGRISSRPHRIEIWFAPDGERVYLLSGGKDRSDWVKNLMANPTVTLEIGGVTRGGIAAVLDPDSEDDRKARQLLVTKYQKDNELVEWGRKSLAVAVVFETGR